MLADLGHAPAAQLQNCHTVDDITAVLQSQTQAVGDLRQRGRIFESIKATVSTLTPTSSVAYVADDVSQKTLMDPLTSLTIFPDVTPTWEGNIRYSWHRTGGMYHFRVHI